MIKSKLEENENQKIASYLVDAESGNITDVFLYGDSYKKYSKEDKEKRLDFLKQEDKCINWNEGVSFVKLYDDVLEELNKSLTNVEFNFAIRLAKHISYKDCILRTNGNPNGKILDAKDIAILLEMDDSNVRRLISSLIKKGILGRHTTGCKDDPSNKIKAITCNPFIFTRGNKVNDTIVSLFANSKWGDSKKKN